MGLEDMEKSLVLRRQRLEQRLADRREALEARMAARSQFEGVGKVEPVRDTPPPDRCDSQAMPAVACKPVESIASVHSHGVKEMRRMFCEPYGRPRRFSSSTTRRR